jgi:hypothetical protein
MLGIWSDHATHHALYRLDFIILLVSPLLVRPYVLAACKTDMTPLCPLHLQLIIVEVLLGAAEVMGYFHYFF